MTHLGTLREFLSRARRRSITAVVADQALVALGAAMAGAILLLIVGTQILDWYWPVLLCGASFLTGLVRTLGRVPSAYRLAQQIDARLGLHDGLSSGYYFAGAGSNEHGAAELRQLVAGRAVELCHGIRPELAVPVRAPRSMYATSALVLAACGMFGIRYGIRRSLDLRPPLVESVIDFFRPTKQIADARKSPARRTPKSPSSEGQAVFPENTVTPETATQDEYPPLQGDPLRADRKEIASQGEDDPAADSDEAAGGDRAMAADGKPGEDSEAGNQKGQDNARSDQKKAGEQGENSSLLDKMRDAFQNMLAKLKIDTKGLDSRQTASKAGKPGGTQKQSGGEKGETAQNRAPGKGAPRPDQEGDQMAAGGENAQAAQGQSSRRPEDDPAEGEKSGIGKSDGNKDIRDAEQLAAMGKISELFGKRQANLTGEVLVEVSSSKPQGLKTPYTDRGGTHAEAGGEIHRDEIPLIYQQYVQHYFEQVRKPAPEPVRQR